MSRPRKALLAACSYVALGCGSAAEAPAPPPPEVVRGRYVPEGDSGPFEAIEFSETTFRAWARDCDGGSDCVSSGTYSLDNVAHTISLRDEAGSIVTGTTSNEPPPLVTAASVRPRWIDFVVTPLLYGGACLIGALYFRGEFRRKYDLGGEQPGGYRAQGERNCD
jgi:hypothetical protein